MPLHHAFLYISLPSLHDYDVKMPNCKFYGGRKRATTNFFNFPSLKLSALLKKSTRGKFAYICRFHQIQEPINRLLSNWNKRDSVWKTGILVKSYVFTTVAVVDAQAPVTLEELCKRIRHCYATLRQARNKRNVGSCWFKSLTSSKLCSTTPNHFQPTGCENECKMKDPTMLRPCCAGLWDNSLIAWLCFAWLCFVLDL